MTSQKENTKNKHPLTLPEMEYETLREELKFLKECQIRYFWIAMTATGAIFGLGSKLGTSISDLPKDLTALFYLSPLIIILPCWLVFFDKATTISRIVGYLRILECHIISGTDSPYVYRGWENSLSLFRETQQNKEKDIKNAKRFITYLKDAGTVVPLIFTFRAVYRYWIINWLTFFALAMLCLCLGYIYTKDNKIVPCFVSVIFFVITLIHNLYILKNIINGKLSFSNHEKGWADILKLSKGGRDVTS